MVIVENETGDDELAVVMFDNFDDGEDDSGTGDESRITQVEDDTLDICGSLIGIRCQSFEETYELYCKHAREIGFSVRKHSARVNCSGETTQKYYVCSSQGMRRKKNVQQTGRQIKITRTDCKAHIRVKRIDGMFEVVAHIEEHNHTLTRKEWSHKHRSHRKIGNEKADIIESMVSSGIRPSDSYRYMVNEAGGGDLVGHTMKDHLNFAHKLKLSVIEAGDAQSVIDMLSQEGTADENFFYRFKLDDAGRLSNIFWRDSMMYEDYQLFGDVVVFDTTYRTNKYNLICAPFVGLNHHKKNVMFGCAFINDEKIETFEWLFEVFLKSMKMKCPVTIFTDQDRAITNAIGKVFHGAKHRLCIWHLYQNAVSRFGKLKGNKDFHDQFDKCLSGCVDEAEFQECWTSLMETYGLQENSWFNHLYELREKWCTAYNKSYFSAGMLSSQRSESTNSALGFRASKSTNLNQFFKIFKTTVENWRETERQNEFDNQRAMPLPRLPLVGMLKHASEVYTHSIFTDFEDAWLKSISTTVNYLGEDFDMKVYDVDDPDTQTLHRVNFCAANNFISCLCKRFEEYGLLCCHCLRILDRNSVKAIPSCYILTRWTKLAKDDLWNALKSANSQVSGLAEFNPWRHKMARNYYSLVIKSQASKEGRTIMEEGYKRMAVEIEALTAIPSLIDNASATTSSIKVQDPAKATTKGRRKREKAPIETRRKKHNNAANSHQNEFGTKTPNLRLF